VKNLLMIVVDCARSEKTIIDLPQGSPLTRRSAPLPFMEYLRTEGTTWTDFHAVSSTTTPNFASMFTGLLPVQHGIQEHSRYSLLDDVTTVAEILSNNGYHSCAEVTGPLIPETGLDRGFTHYRWRDRTEYLHNGFLQYLGDFLPSLMEPWFLCLHLWEAHQPYQDPEPFNANESGLTPYDRALSFVDHILYYALNGLDLSRTSVIYCGDHGERLECDYRLNQALGGKEISVLQTFYQFTAEHPDSFSYDEWFRRLHEDLGEITARIYAHNVLGHGFHLTEDLIRTPLVIVDKERCEEGAIRTNLRTQTDLFATILDLAGIPCPIDHSQTGRSLLNDLDEDMIYIEANGSGGKQYESRCYLRGAKSRRWKYWRIEADGLEHQVLWDLENDPRETTNVASTHPDICKTMGRFVDKCLENRRSHLVDLEKHEAEEIEKRLRDLGYIE